MSDTRVHGYVRISTRSQNEIRQVSALKAFGIADRDIYIDKASGKDFRRPEYERLLNAIRAGDLVVVLSLDRLARDYTALQGAWRHITNDLGADIKILDMPLLDTREINGALDNKFVSDLTLQILSYVAEKERENIKARQAQGIAAAKERGKVLGRPKATYPDNWQEVYALWHDKKEITAKAAMERLGLKRNTFYKLVREYQKT